MNVMCLILIDWALYKYFYYDYQGIIINMC